MKVLLTGGAGYIGSHTCLELLVAGHEVVVIDNFSNSNPIVFDRIESICGRRPTVYQDDVCNSDGVSEVLLAHQIQAVIHFAGLKALGESAEQPLRYYNNNVQGSLSLLSAMKTAKVRILAFSSSATVYGSPNIIPINEDAPTSATNPYGRSKIMVEEILRDLTVADDSLHIALLRYFNPVGAHESGLIGEDPTGIPNNLMPLISQVASGRREVLQIYGDDYPTVDGTGIRDYIHVMDLARGHVAALDWLQERKGVHAFNLGTGQGKSVLEVIQSYETTTGQAVPYQIVGRRLGDVAACYADSSLAERELGWKAQLSVDEMCRDEWNWQNNNPNGYRK